MTSGDDIDAEQHDLNELFYPKWWYRDLRMAKTSKPVHPTLRREKRVVLVKRGFSSRQDTSRTGHRPTIDQ